MSLRATALRALLSVTLAGLVAPGAFAQDGATGAHGGITADLDCSTCHSTEGWRMAESAGAEGGFDHARTGFALVGRHADTSCGSCHRGASVTSACSSCHDDPHARRLGDDCSACHTAKTWLDTDTLSRHRRSRLPLVGKHAIIECAACHRRQTPRSYASTPADCFACHADDYRGDQHPDHDGDPADPGQAAFPRQCARCHTPLAWTPALIQPPTAQARRALLRHDARFVLSQGPHRGAPCQSCHPSANRVRAVACNGCHGGVELRRQHPRARVSRRASGCLSCHPTGRAR